MSIRSTVGNFSHNVSDNISTALNTAKTQFSNIVGTAKTGLSSVWAGGFVGMSDSGFSELDTAITNYIAEVQDIINGFDETGDISSAFQGELQEAAYDFIEASKETLTAYVSFLKQDQEEMKEAYENFKLAASSVASDVRANAESIRSNANSIRLD